MSNTYLIIGGAFVFIIALWVAVGVRHLKFLKKGVDGSWEFLDEKIRKRHDLLPILIETVRAGASDSNEIPKYVQKAVLSRDLARRIYLPSGEKTEKEYYYSKGLGDLIWFGEENETVSKNTSFLELREEVQALNSDIENRSKEYNENVRIFNSGLKIFLLKPLSFLMGFKQALIFEFEK